MKTKPAMIGLLLLLPVLLFSQKNTQQTIDELLTDWHNAAAVSDQESYFNFIDENGIYIGTDSTEIWDKQAFFEWSKPHFDKGKGWSLKATKRNIYIAENGNFAWFDELLAFPGGTLRGSGILEKNNNAWKIKHYVLSLPVPNDKFKSVLEVIQMDQENNQKKD
jgi:ketosteroid isomerase-like protein